MKYSVEINQGEEKKIHLDTITTEDLLYLKKISNKYKKLKITEKRKYIIIQTDSLAGTIQLSKKRIEIRPKLLSNQWNKALFFMLLISQKEYPKWLYKETAYSETDNFNNFIIRQFILEIKKIISDGLLHSYTRENERLKFIRGKINFKELIQLKFDSRIPCTNFERSINIPENQILLITLNYLSKLKLTNDIKNEAIILKDYFDTVSNGDDLNFLLSKINYNRNNSKYSQSHTLAKLILENQDIAFSKGLNINKSFLVDMEKLFQNYLLEIIALRLGSKYLVKSSEKKIEGKESNIVKTLSVTPDIVIYERKTKIPLLIVDAKYKRPFKKGRFGKKTLNTNDLFQVGFYSTEYKCSSILVYPRYEDEKDLIRDEFQLENHKISFATIDVVKEPENIGKDLTDFIKSQLPENLNYRKAI